MLLLLKGTSKNLTTVRLSGIFSSIKLILRNTSVFQEKSMQSGGKRRAKMMGGQFLEMPL